ncbi:hypothetical protein PAPYR_11234 [Paratrimastix pyriformis]|uniref:ORC1/DEAH AAA+ ATPase domain-containing protein n=1 Tax=Paratrimastix pyriformis TaxID=342808 RepID=A0ABQ8U486_9EUKA|nr:hypothetical protein PAPYR_11234 [Paratrimastix pyriformis]
MPTATGCRKSKPTAACTRFHSGRASASEISFGEEAVLRLAPLRTDLRRSSSMALSRTSRPDLLRVISEATIKGAFLFSVLCSSRFSLSEDIALPLSPGLTQHHAVSSVAPRKRTWAQNRPPTEENYFVPRTRLVDFLSAQMRGPRDSRILFLGSCQTGKSTLCGLIANKLVADPTLAVVKCDTRGDTEDLLNKIIDQLPLPTPASHPLSFKQHIAAFQKATGRRPCVLVDEFTRLDSPGEFLAMLKQSGNDHRFRADHRLGAPSPAFLRAETIELFAQWAQDVDLAQYGEAIGGRVYELALGHVGMTSSIGLALDEGTFRGCPVAEFLRAQCAVDDSRSPADRLRCALADYTSSPEFFNFLVMTHCPASAVCPLAALANHHHFIGFFRQIMDEVVEHGLLPTLSRVLAPFRPFPRARGPEDETLAQAVVTGALIYERGAYRASSPMIRSLATGSWARAIPDRLMANRRLAVSPARLAVMAKLPEVREALLRPNDQEYCWDTIHEAILAICSDLDDLRDLTMDELVDQGIPDMLAERVVAAIAAVLARPLATGS